MLFPEFSENKEDNCKHYNKRVEDMLENIVNDKGLSFLEKSKSFMKMQENVQKINRQKMKEKCIFFIKDRKRFKRVNKIYQRKQYKSWLVC